MATLQEWVSLYLRHLEVRNYSPQTISSTEWRLKPFLAFLESKGIKDPNSITVEIVRNYQTYLFYYINAKGKQNSVGYRNIQLLYVKYYLRYLYAEKAIKEDPGENVELARAPKRLPRYILTETEVQRFLDSPDKTTVLGYRDKTILEILYSNGIRRSELLNLKLQDIDLSEEVIRINSGKGGKDRIVPIGKIACQCLKRYLTQIRPYMVRDSTNEYVFLSREGNRVSKSMLGLRIKRYAKEAGIEKNVTPHTLRATCATHCIQGKNQREQMHPRYVMELLGHASLEALNPYLSVSIVDLKEAHRRCHPREKKKG
jgi:integrase/recombinase XerD